MPTNKAFVELLNEKTDHQPLLMGVPQTSGMRAGRVYLLPGHNCGEHSTGDYEEMLVFLSGNGQAIIGDKTFAVGKGKITYIPPQTIHNIKNNSDEPLVYIFCVASASHNHNGGHSHE
ncbi:MAG: cupin domain-containing protein [Sedimentisphaerales bacterium]